MDASQVAWQVDIHNEDLVSKDKASAKIPGPPPLNCSTRMRYPDSQAHLYLWPSLEWDALGDHPHGNSRVRLPRQRSMQSKKWVQHAPGQVLLGISRNYRAHSFSLQEGYGCNARNRGQVAFFL
ncbi:hypothetical protein HPP92_028704 [Vanilla planifolia]|uniref:Uncharacterized protein n=1 Tax=Vanilla planifolia TaxID=51239 RepID=A0A835P6T8_VANPL|nr:hypothetical protein HPP92_028704 [Vanilla planifolia]KAG0446729.1 hypothetical protein HPP92_028689 [Vanilla planifolia]